MDAHRWTNEELEAGLQALVRTVAPDGALPAGAARCVGAVQSFLGTRFDASRLAPIDLPTLAARLHDPWLRQQLVRTLVVAVLVDRDPTRAQLARIRAVATALDVVEPGIRDLELYLAGRRLRLRLHVLRRFWAVDQLRARIAERGFLRAVVPAVLATFFRRYRNRDLAARFHALRSLPDDSLGRGFLSYLATNGFPVPGELGAVSDIIVAHDLVHVLGDYGTTPAEEVLVACFSAGHRVEDPFAFVLFVLFQFHLGVQMTPGAAPETGYFDPVTALEAVRRGAEVPRDLTGAWDYGAVLDQPVAALRARLRIAPRAVRQSGAAREPQPSDPVADVAHALRASESLGSARVDFVRSPSRSASAVGLGEWICD